MKRLSNMILILILVFCLLFPGYSAAFTDAAEQETVFEIYSIVDRQRIDLWTNETENYLFLPASANLHALEFHAESEQSERALALEGNLGSCELNGPVDVTALSSENEGTYTLIIRDDNTSEMFPIKIMCAACQPSVFLYSADRENEGRDFVDASKSNVTTGSMSMVDNNGDVLNIDLTQIKARGNSTFYGTDKKSYQIKLSKKAALLNNDEKVKTWVLLAGANDATKVHDKTMKELAASLGMPYVASSNWVNLYYDGEYRGLYLLSEKNQVNKTGVDIFDMEDAYQEINENYGENPVIETGENGYGQSYLYTEGLVEPEDFSGGYLLELNGNSIDEASGFHTRQERAVNVKSPEWAGKETIQYISEFYQEFEDAVYATDDSGNYTGRNPKTGKYYYDYADKESLVRLFLLGELTRNQDEFIHSTFFYKDKGSDVMYCGPIWDQEMVFGTAWGYRPSPEINSRFYLTKALAQIPDFRDAVREYYQSCFAEQTKALLGSDGILAANTSQVRESVEMDHILWPYVKIANPNNAEHLWPTETTYQDVVDDMTDWVEKRIEFMDWIYGPGTSGPLEPASNDPSDDDNGNGGNGNNGGNGGTIPGGDPVPVPSEPDPEPIDEDPVPAALDFEDVLGDAYFHDAVDWAVSKDITNGIDETHFGPDNSCTRAQMVTFLWRAAGSPETPSQSASQTAPPQRGAKECPFTDVAEDAYYYRAVLWAVEQGITTGTSDTTFSPDAAITRGQSVTFLYRMKNPSQSASQTAPPKGGAKMTLASHNEGSEATLASPFGGGVTEGDGEGPPTFTDVPQDAYYYNAVLWAAQNGVTTGKTDTLFAPDDDCTRAQIVTFLYRAMVK